MLFDGGTEVRFDFKSRNIPPASCCRRCVLGTGGRIAQAEARSTAAKSIYQRQWPSWVKKLIPTLTCHCVKFLFGPRISLLCLDGTLLALIFSLLLGVGN
jgi:hypothetical protein